MALRKDSSEESLWAKLKVRQNRKAAVALLKEEDTTRLTRETVEVKQSYTVEQSFSMRSEHSNGFQVGEEAAKSLPSEGEALGIEFSGTRRAEEEAGPRIQQTPTFSQALEDVQAPWLPEEEPKMDIENERVQMDFEAMHNAGGQSPLQSELRSSTMLLNVAPNQAAVMLPSTMVLSPTSPSEGPTDLPSPGTNRDVEKIDVLDSVNSRLQAELLEFRSSVDSKHTNLTGKFVDMTTRVDVLAADLEREHEFRMAIETKLASMREHLVGISDLSKVLQDMSQRIDLLEQSMHKKHELFEKRVTSIATSMETVQQETYATMRLELAEVQLRGDVHKGLDMQAKSQQSHASAEELQNVSESLHGKLRLELLELRSGIDRKHSSLVNDLADVTQRVDMLNDTMDREHKLRMAMETKIETKSEQLRTDLQMSFQEAHIAIKGKMAAMDMEHHAKHAHNADNVERLEAILQDTVEVNHAKLQEELRSLKSSQTASTSDLSRVMGDVTQQFESLDEVMRKEHELRMIVETRMERMASEQDRVVFELREEVRTAQREAHAALKLELADHGRGSADIEAAMHEVRRVLRNEHGNLAERLDSYEQAHRSTVLDLERQLRNDFMKSEREHGNLAERLDSYEQAHRSTVLDLERQLRNDFMSSQLEIESCHRNLEEMARHNLNHDAFGQRMSLLESSFQRMNLLESSFSDKHDEVCRELQGHKSKNELHYASADERMAALERQLTAQSEFYSSLNVQLSGEARMREEAYAIFENRLSRMEGSYSEMSDKHSKNVENACASLRGAMNNFFVPKAEHEKHTSFVEQRLQYLDKAIMDHADANSRAFSAFQNKHGKEVLHFNDLLHAERASREVQQQSFFDSIADAKKQIEELKAQANEQMRLDRVLCEMQVRQLKEAVVGNTAESTDIIMQERASREHTERTLQQRLGVFELTMQAERQERLEEMIKLRDAFDHHIHRETLHTAPVREVGAVVREVSPVGSPVVRQTSAPRSPVVRQASAPRTPTVVRQTSVPTLIQTKQVMKTSAIISSPRATMSPRSSRPTLPMSPASVASPSTWGDVGRRKVAPPKVEHGAVSPAIEKITTSGKPICMTPRTPLVPSPPHPPSSAGSTGASLQLKAFSGYTGSKDGLMSPRRQK